MGVAGQKIAGVNQNIAQTQQTWNQVGSTVSQAGAAWGGPETTSKKNNNVTDVNNTSKDYYDGEFMDTYESDFSGMS